jgi:hypothetical protein
MRYSYQNHAMNPNRTNSLNVRDLQKNIRKIRDNEKGLNHRVYHGGLGEYRVIAVRE